jgi:hypothetical protein
MGWSNDALLELLLSFIQSRRPDAACVGYLYERAENESMEEAC